MARLSKTYSFKICEDAGIPTPEHDETDPFDDRASQSRPAALSENGEDGTVNGAIATQESPINGVNSRAQSVKLNSQHQASLQLLKAQDTTRRESGMTATSISSFPCSDSSSTRPPRIYNPPTIRPSFRRPSSVRRMQMASPPPSPLALARRSPQSLRSRSRTPRSVRSTPRRISEHYDESDDTDDQQQQRRRQEPPANLPLVLLHITLLPVTMPWNRESMRAVLPASTERSFDLLRSKVSDTIVQRGVLIPHPREEYELLEERLVEALGLKEERVTKCGHFNLPEGERSEGWNDSGAGSSGDEDVSREIGEDGAGQERCEMCLRRIKWARDGVDKRWSVKVFAANGLMHSATWAAAWAEMERVDVEILPWIDDEVVRELDRRRDEEDLARDEAESDQERRPILDERRIDAWELCGTEKIETNTETAAKANSDREFTPEDTIQPRSLPTEDLQPPSRDLPPVYRASQIPVPVLLRNYIFLLAQDRRNVAIAFFGLIAVVFALRMAVAPQEPTAVLPVTVHDTNPLLVNSPLALPDAASPTQDFADDSAAPQIAVESDAMQQRASSPEPFDVHD